MISKKTFKQVVAAAVTSLLEDSEFETVLKAGQEYIDGDIIIQAGRLKNKNLPKKMLYKLILQQATLGLYIEEGRDA